MSPRPTYTKPDKNQREIIDELQARGFDVDRVCDLPGLYDLVVSGLKGFQTTVNNEYLRCVTTASVRVEIKSEGGKLNETEVEYREAQRHKGSLIVAYCTEDITRWFNQ